MGAGYFRARIKGLTPFDKVVGGLTWCLQNCAVQLEVDLLYQENLSIGQKIALTEKIVSVLPQMKCPVQIEPHQIQVTQIFSLHINLLTLITCIVFIGIGLHQLIPRGAVAGEAGAGELRSAEDGGSA